MNHLMKCFVDGFIGSFRLTFALIVSLLAGLSRVFGRLLTAFVHHDNLPVDTRVRDTRPRRRPA